ncbi:exosortase-associated protein EpsI, B-type [Rhodoferax sp.]|uniref:exosortase-associated protein EpsI, B-type n=1 Tax=Rhodoferax sp. TaxID=50421 RepID=UPI001ED21735|nr:exosortase-associated protein EpsI, B-type [Rhodoferax sp.]MBT9507768.1 EpsI family protein [Rhodoferax sp.]
MRLSVKSLILLALMLLSAGLATALRPTNKLADQRPAINFETMIPKSFGEWQELQQATAQIIDPKQREFIEKIYKQTLTRTYVNASGARIMLSLAYVENQSDSFGVHLPEVCYPAQGFQISDRFSTQVKTADRSIPVGRMVAKLGARVEPISYWVTVGDSLVASSTDRKVEQMRNAIRGNIPDGMLVRVSSISADTANAYTLHGRFINDFEAALPKNLRALLYGQGGPR